MSKLADEDRAKYTPKKKQTNLEKIRAMSVEELAEFLSGTENCDECDFLLNCKDQCVDDWKKYLLSDANIKDFLFGTDPCEPVKEGGE